MLYESKLSSHTAESTKNICWMKGESAVDYSTIRLQEPRRSGKDK